MLHNPQELSLFPRLTDSDIDQFRRRAVERVFGPKDLIFQEEESDYDRGSIHVSSEPGHTAVVIYLPLRHQPVA